MSNDVEVMTMSNEIVILHNVICVIIKSNWNKTEIKH